jgi:hypothetical protein
VENGQVNIWFGAKGRFTICECCKSYQEYKPQNDRPPTGPNTGNSFWKSGEFGIFHSLGFSVARHLLRLAVVSTDSILSTYFIRFDPWACSSTFPKHSFSSTLLVLSDFESILLYWLTVSSSLSFLRAFSVVDMLPVTSLDFGVVSGRAM